MHEKDKENELNQESVSQDSDTTDNFEAKVFAKEAINPGNDLKKDLETDLESDLASAKKANKDPHDLDSHGLDRDQDGDGDGDLDAAGLGSNGSDPKGLGEEIEANPEVAATALPSNADEGMFVHSMSTGVVDDVPKEEPVKVEADDPTKRPRWYIVHTYSGYEQRVQKTINELKRTGQDQGLIEEVIVPTEKVVEVAKGGQKRTITRKSYPGYVLVRMIMTDLSWHLVQSIPKVTGFIGGKNRPAPMRDSEAEHILNQMRSSLDTPKPKFNYGVGEEVRVIDGPFGGFNAIVQEVNYDKGKLTVAVSIFGRQTPMELDFSQVARG